MNSLDKMLSVLNLFSDQTSSVTPEDVALLTDVSRSSAYRYLQSLADAGLVTTLPGGGYGLGARILELDRLQRNSDSLLQAARPAMAQNAADHGINLILSRYHGSKVICSHTEWPDSTMLAGYERGLPLPMFHGAMAKVILANLSLYQLRSLMLGHIDAIRDAGLGQDWKKFRLMMTRLRKQGAIVTYGEISKGSVGIAAPIFDGAGHVIGSVAYTMAQSKFESLAETELCETIQQLAATISAALAQEAAPQPPLAAEA